MTNVQVVLSGLSMRLISFVHVCPCICCGYGCMYSLVAFLLVCVNIMAISSAYEVSCSGDDGCGMCNMYMLKSVGDRTPLLGTPVLNWSCVDVCSLKVVYALRPLMQFKMNLIMVFGTRVCRRFPESLCMFTESKALLMSRVTVIVRAGSSMIQSLGIVLL